MNLSYSLQFGAVHGVVVSTILQVLITRDIGHHAFVGHKVVVATVFLIRSRGACRICEGKGRGLSRGA